MIPKTPNSTVATGGLKTSDPRIISPEIKVIYPSENEQKDLVVSQPQTTVSTEPVLLTTPLSTIETTKESTVITKETTTPITTQTPKVPTWKETLKEHAGLFIAVALISVGIGFLIGKRI